MSGSGYIGDAAEFFVASECSRRGWKCSVVKGNAPSCDLIVANPDTSEAKVIEVKATTSKRNVRWNIGYVPDSNDLIYVLVHFKGEFSQHWESESFKPERPEVYILTIQEMKKLWSEDSGSYNNTEMTKEEFYEDVSNQLIALWTGNQKEYERITQKFYECNEVVIKMLKELDDEMEEARS